MDGESGGEERGKVGERNENPERKLVLPRTGTVRAQTQRASRQWEKWSDKVRRSKAGRAGGRGVAGELRARCRGCSYTWARVSECGHAGSSQNSLSLF